MVAFGEDKLLSLTDTDEEEDGGVEEGVKEVFFAALTKVAKLAGLNNRASG